MADIIEISELDLAECLGLSGRRIRQLHKDDIVVKTQRGKYDLKASVKGYIKFIKDSEKSDGGNIEKLKMSKEAATLSHELLKKRKTELQVEQMEKKLHRAEDVEFFWNTMVLAAKSRLTAIPVKAAPLLVGIEDRKEVQAILKREISEALNEIANYDVNMFDVDFEDDTDGAEAE